MQVLTFLIYIYIYIFKKICGCTNTFQNGLLTFFFPNQKKKEEISRKIESYWNGCKVDIHLHTVFIREIFFFFKFLEYFWENFLYFLFIKAVVIPNLIISQR